MADEVAIAPAFSVIVPVFNEAGCIADHAAALLDGLPAGSELVFSLNGCTDASESILRARIGDRARILVRAEAGKALAIRAAEKWVTAFPRFYVDADVLVHGAMLAALAARMAEDDLDLIAPAVAFDLSGATPLVSTLQRIWQGLPHGQSTSFHLVLGVSRAGRARWGDFPDVIADDAFIASQITAGRRAIASDMVVLTRQADHFWPYVRMRARWAQGNIELAALGYRILRAPGQRQALFAAVPQHGLVPTLAYFAAVLLARLLANLPHQMRPRWHHDRARRLATVPITGAGRAS